MSLPRINFLHLTVSKDITGTRFDRLRSLSQGQRSNQGPTMTLHTYTPNQCPYQVSTSYTLRFLRYSLHKIFKLKVTTARSKVKSRSDHDVAHLYLLTNVLPNINFLHLTISEIQPGQLSRHPPTRTPWVKTIP